MLESAWQIHVSSRSADRRVSDVDTGQVEAWIGDMIGAGQGSMTVLRAEGVLSGILGLAVKSRRIPANPAVGVENLPRKHRKRPVYLTADDVAWLADESGDRRTLVFVLAYWGPRWSEAMPGFVAEMLAAEVEGRLQAAPVFPGPDGGFLERPKSTGGWFAGAVKRAGVPAITPHDLRHTAASLAVSAGVNVKALQRMLGHASAAMTLDVYADLFDEDLDTAADRIHERYAASVVPKMCPQGAVVPLR